MPLRPGAVSYAKAQAPKCASVRSFQATVIAFGSTSPIGAVHRGSSWNWPCWPRQRPRPSRSCHGSTCYGTLGVVHSCVQPTLEVFCRALPRPLSRTVESDNADVERTPRRFFGPKTGNQPILADPPHTATCMPQTKSRSHRYCVMWLMGVSTDTAAPWHPVCLARRTQRCEARGSRRSGSHGG